MPIRISIIFIALFILLALIVGTILLQIYLSKKENKWLGLILPIITLCISLIVIFGVVVFSVAYHNTINSTIQVIDENGIVIEEETSETITQPIQSSSSLIFTIIYVFILYNIPTAVLLMIYLGSREKLRRKKLIEKMKVQDLE